MDIGIKTSFKEDQLISTLEKGIPFLEFHTFYNDFNGSVDFKKIRKYLDNYNTKCHSVHAPMDDGISKNLEAICIGTLDMSSRKRNIEIFKKTIDAAGILCDYDRPVVVTHIGTCNKIDDSKYNNLTKEAIYDCIQGGREDLHILNDYLVKNYPHISVVVENMPVFSYGEDEKTIINWYFGRDYDLPEMIEKLNLSNIGTCLDVCHAQNTINMLKVLNNDKRTITEFIIRYSNSMRLMHLNKCIGMGELFKYHSQPFMQDSKEDREYLYNILKIFDDLNIKAPITLEINEYDFIKKENITETLKTVDNVLKLI